MTGINSMKHGFLIRCALPALLFALSPAYPGPRVSDDLPAADTILEKFIEATGGRAAYAKLYNILSRGTFEVRGTRMRGTYLVYEASPDKTRSILNAEGVEKMEEGTLGSLAWENSTTGGARIKEGEEKAFALREATFNSCLYWKKLYLRAETVGTGIVDGRTCYKVQITPAQGKPIIDYYDIESGLRLKSVITLNTPSEEILTETYYSDYRKSNTPVSFPFKLFHKSKKEETVVELVSVRCNVDIAWNRFDPPLEIKSRLAKSQR